MYSLVKFALISCLILSLFFVTAFAQGDPIPASSAVSGQKLGSVLVYNFYTARANEETDLSLTNTNATDSVAVHLFFVNGTTNQAADTFVTLAPRQTVSLLASNTDPGNAGYVVAVAVHATSGCPISFNYLSGDAYIKLASGLMTSLPAEAFAALYSNTLGTCNASATTATLAFDGSTYNEAPRALALDSVVSLLDGNNTLLVVNRLGGSLAFGANAASLGASEGVLYASYDIAYAYDFTFSGSNAQFRSFFSHTFPVVPDGFNNVIPAGVTGYMKLWPTNDAGILGALLNFNPNASMGPPFYSGGHNLRYLTVGSSATLTIPVYPPTLKTDLALSLAHTGSFAVGSTGDYTLTVNNAAIAKPATGTIKITGTLPNNLTLQSFSGAGWNCTGTGTANVSCTNTSGLAAGASLPTLTLTVNVGAGTPSSITNTATVSVAPQQESNLTNNSASDSTNSPPTISPIPVTRTAGSPSANSSIANVNDAEDAEDTLTVTVNGNATVNGVTVSGLSVDSAGVVTANVVAACGATNASFTLMVSDSDSLSATATLNVTVNVNTPPTLGTYLNASVNGGGNTTVPPSALPLDNGTINSITATAPGFTGVLSVNPATGLVTISNAGPLGDHTVTVTATDNCGAATITSFTLNVACASFIVSNNADSGAGSLRAAIANACNGGTITFANTVTSPITLASELVINKNLTIQGPGANLLSISGNNASRIFAVATATVATIDGLTVTSGNGMGADGTGNGAAIVNRGTLTVSNCTVSNSTAVYYGGGLYNYGTLTLNNCTVSGNVAGYTGGGLFSVNTVTVINSTLTGNQNYNFVGGGMYVSGMATVTNTTFSNNQSGAGGGHGGGVYVDTGGTAMFSDCTFTGNIAGFGAGLANAGTVTLTNSKVANNTVTGSGGGLFNTNMLTVTNSTLSNNQTGNFVGAGLYTSATAVLTNTTISNNQAGGGGLRGGGIFIDTGGAVTLTYCTITGNAASAGGGIYNLSTLSAKNSIIAKNTITVAAPDVFGPLTSQGFNLIGNSSGATIAAQASDQIGTATMPLDPLLGALANNGGPTQTHALLFGSPALDKGSAATGVTTDQRGLPRPVDFAFITNATGGNGSDIGAFEIQTLSPPTIVATSVTRQRGSPSGAAVTIATVSDADDAAGTLAVAMVTGGTAAGITLGPLTNTNGTITATVAAGCTAGSGSVRLRVTDSSGLTSTADLIVNVTVNTSPSLGNYPPMVQINPGASTFVTPTAAPADNGTMNLTVSAPGFTGILSVNQTTGVVTINNAGPTGLYVVTVQATDNCGFASIRTFNVTVNRPPLINGIPVQRQSGSAPQSSSIIANVNDLEDAENTLLMKVNGGSSATVNGVTVSNISVDFAGIVRANVIAACNNETTTTTTTFTLMVTDSGGVSSTATFPVTVSPNTPPTLGIYSSTTISLVSSPAIVNVLHLGSPPSDNGTISSMTVAAPGVPGNTLSVNPNTGNVKITKAGMPIGERTVTVTAIDNCGAKTTRDFKVNVKF